MPRDFDAAASDYLQTADGGAAIDMGYGSLAALVLFDTVASDQSLVAICSATTNRLALRINASAQIVLRRSTTNSACTSITLSAGVWYLLVVTKETGNVYPRAHAYNVAAGTWSHAGCLTTVSDPTALADHVNLGVASNDLSFFLDGRMAAAAIWKQVVLSDAQCEALSGGYLHWLMSAPAAMWILDQSATSQKVVDLVGGCHESILSGTSVAAESCPFGYGGPELEAQAYGAAAASPDYFGWLAADPDLRGRVPLPI